MAESKKGAAAPKAKLEKSRKKEIKARLNAEAGKEIRPLAIGTVAMMASALANQGEWHILPTMPIDIKVDMTYVFFAIHVLTKYNLNHIA